VIFLRSLPDQLLTLLALRQVRYMAGLPLSANVLQMTVMATVAPLVGRG
jgi:hypothetical protein